MDVASERRDESTLATGSREVVDECRSGGEEHLEVVLDRAVGDRDGEVGLPTPGLAHEDERAPLGHEVGGECRTEQREAQRRLVGEVELVDGLEEGELGVTRESLDARLLSLGNLLGDEHGEEVAVGPLLAFGASDEIAPDTPGVGEAQALEQCVELDLGGVHSGSASCAGAVAPR